MLKHGVDLLKEIPPRGRRTMKDQREADARRRRGRSSKESDRERERGRQLGYNFQFSTITAQAAKQFSNKVAGVWAAAKRLDLEGKREVERQLR